MEPRYCSIGLVLTESWRHDRSARPTPARMAPLHDSINGALLGVFDLAPGDPFCPSTKQSQNVRNGVVESGESQAMTRMGSQPNLLQPATPSVIP
jgi:hypothetical protein